MAPPAVLSIAGSDSGGGAGIQADLKAFARCGVHGMTAITALTAQNTTGVTGIHPVPPEFIVEQVRAVHEDIGVDAVKIGMLGTAEIVRAVREALELLGPARPIVIDPVMVSESGAVLLDDAARQAIVDELLPLATVITPNLPEARVLAGGAGGEPAAWARGGDAGDDVARPGQGAARARPAGRCHNRRPPRRDRRRVLRRSRTSTRSPVSDIRMVLRMGRAVPTRARWQPTSRSGYTPLQAAERARAIASEAVAHGLRHIGRGAGPVDALNIAVRGVTARQPGATAPAKSPQRT